MNKIYQVLFSFLLLLQSNLAFSMHEQNWREYACGFVYGHADLTGRKVNVPLAQVSKAIQSDNIDLAACPKNEWSEFFEASARGREQSELHKKEKSQQSAHVIQVRRNTDYNRKLLRINTEMIANQSDKPKGSSPKSVKFNLSPE